MKQGLQLMQEGRSETLLEALSCFDRARDLRSGLPIDNVPVYRYGLAACWLNRAEALLHLRDITRLPEAVDACEQGIALLEALNPGEDPRFPRRLAMGHHNRGLALLIQGGTSEAIAAFRHAVAVLDDERSAGIPDRRYLQAAIGVNMAQALMASGNDSWTDARNAALRSIELLEDAEAENAEAAAVGLQARHVICRALAARLDPSSGTPVSADDLHMATDAADDALNLAREWEQRGVTMFRALACDLFRFGARVYAVYQPHFLQEFVADNMDPSRSSPEYVDSPEMRAAAHEALALEHNEQPASDV